VFNAVKHAQVESVALELALDADGQLRITVSDQGVEFEQEGLDHRSDAGQVGCGLFSIRERLTLPGGRFEIDSAPGKETRSATPLTSSRSYRSSVTHPTALRRSRMRYWQSTRCAVSAILRPIMLLRRNLSKTRCDERQSADICFFAESFIRIAAPEQLACNDVLGAVFDSQLEASLNPVGATGEIAVTRAAHRP
jgi:hypothetical protein